MARRSDALRGPLIGLVALAACGGAAPAAPMVIAPDQPIGWIGLAPRAPGAPGDWLPAAPASGRASVIVPMPVEGLAAGTRLTASDTAGHRAQVTAGAPSKIAYGCDQNQLDVVALAGERLAPGPVWLLPPHAPASWQPRPVAITQVRAASATSRREQVGPLVIDVKRSDATHGTLAITRPGHTMYSAPFVRDAMAGAPAEPIDLRTDGIAVPVPIAAWSLAAGGPILIVLRAASYEGTRLSAILVEAERARELPAMASYLYSCAF